MENDCLFCRIAGGQTDTTFIYEDDNLVVFKDINPHAPVHWLVVPKKHIRSINDLTESDQDLVALMIDTARRMAEKAGIARPGYKLLFNVESGGGQVIFHLHLHLLGGWERK
ncbi:MAG: histidine triad nucleotide-binding protein [Desulfobacterales bacterium]|nr:histidine triad nucleotide-binding protein [Desulfobacterales bacterium]